MSEAMEKSWRILLFAVAGWVNREQLKVIDYLKQENRLLRAQIKKKRVRLSESDRRKLAEKRKSDWTQEAQGSGDDRMCRYDHGMVSGSDR